MARCGALIAWATTLGLKDAAGVLGQALAEEKKADALLAKVSGTIDRMAMAA